MVDLRAEMAQLWASLGPPPADRGRVLQFVSATVGEGASTMAREFARFAAGRSARPVWLVDLDLAGAGQHRAIAAAPRVYGDLGVPAAATPDGSIFFTVQPAGQDSHGRPVPDARYICAQQVGGAAWWVTRFRRELLRPGQAPRFSASAAYWQAMRRHAGEVVVDCPAADRSTAAVSLAPYVDGTIIVVAAEGETTRGPAALRDGIEAAGGRCLGLVFNRARIEAPKFLRALLP